MHLPPLPFWAAYGRAILFFFIALMAADWLASVVWGRWLDWSAVLAIATILPALGLMITWDEM